MPVKQTAVRYSCPEGDLLELIAREVKTTADSSSVPCARGRRLPGGSGRAVSAQTLPRAGSGW